jgi:hypothetical protein
MRALGPALRLAESVRLPAYAGWGPERSQRRR